MNVVRVRSPYIKEIAGSYGSTQTGTKVILTIWNDGTTEPTAGQKGYYSLSKPAVSPTQKGAIYNVSNYVKEFIDNVNPTQVFFDSPFSYSDEFESPKEFCNFRIKSYWTATAGDTLITNEVFVGVNGFTQYSDGVNNPNFYPNLSSPYITLLTNTNIKKRITRSDVMDIYANYVDVNIDIFGGAGYAKVFYKTTISGTPVTYEYDVAEGMKKIPLFVPSAISETNDTIVEIKIFSPSGSPIVTRSFSTAVVDECKYEPVCCQFINRYGGWEFLYFFKAQKVSINTTSTDFKLSPQSYQYNATKPQLKSFNTNGKKSIKLNTGWVEENYSDLIQDLMLSETVLLDFVPVQVKTQSSDLKTYLQNKNINYEIEFEYAFDLINNVV